MVTAAAPALPDSHALPQAAAGIAVNSAQPSTSFESVYQSSLLPGDSVPQFQNSKAAGSKRSLSKNTDDNLPAPVSFAAPTSPSERPCTPALPSFSVKANASAAEPEPAAREVAQLSASEEEAAALARLAHLKQSAADASPQGPTSAPSFLLGASLLQVSQVESSPESRQPANSSRSSQTSTSQQPSVDPALFTKGLAAALAPQNGNLAFSLKMMESTLQARHAQQVAQPAPTDRNQAATQAKSEEHSPLALLAPNAAHATSSPTSPAAIPGDVVASAATASPVWNEAAAAAQLDVRPETQLSEPLQPASLSTVAALHDAQPILPEAPRPSATSEILLQLGGKDQAAAIRVTDRAGAVNVSVHATDPDLRSSLRSNLGDLATQLSHQGWKTEVVKTGTTLTRGETPQDPQQGGQRSPGQQQPSSQGERQPQRDRRASSGQWLATFEEQASGNSGNPGGTNS